MDQFVGEIRIFAGNFAPAGWALCDGQLLPISQHTALFSLLGTNYGGDGRSTFALPNLIARSPLGTGQGPGLSPVEVGEQVGTDSVTLTQSEIPSHTHQVYGFPATAPGTTGNPSGAGWARSRQGRVVEQQFSQAAASTELSASAIGQDGADQPHNNLAPYLVLNFIIALQGIFPPRS